MPPQLEGTEPRQHFDIDSQAIRLVFSYKMIQIGQIYAIMKISMTLNMHVFTDTELFNTNKLTKTIDKF